MSPTDSSPDVDTASANAIDTGGNDGGRSTRHRLRVIGFYLALLATIGLFVTLLGEFLVLPFMTLPPEMEAALAPHRFHDTVYTMMLGVALLGLVIQLYRPADKFVGVLGFVVVMALLGVSFVIPVVNGRMPAEDLVLTASFAGLGLVIALLHPSGALMRPKLGDRIDRVVLGLAAIAAIPLLLYLANEYSFQLSGTDPILHVYAGHYGAMATAAGSILVLSIVAVLAPVGWRIAAVGAGLLALIWGGASVVYPGLESSGGMVWGAIAILWAIAFVAATEYAHREDVTSDVSSPKTPKPA